MTTRIEAGALDLGAFIRPGDAIVCGQACGEPTTLTEALVEQRAALGGVSLFVGSAFSRTFAPEHADHIRLASMGAIGSLGGLARAGVLDVIPVHGGQIGAMLANRSIPCDVAFVQVSPAGPDGRHSFGLTHDFVREMVDAARTVVAEINDQVPYTHGEDWLGPERIDILVETSRPPVELAPAAIGAVDRAIAGLAAPFIPDGATLQMGIGAVPEAITALLGDRRGLGVHSGMIGNGIADLMRRGIVDNSRKPFDAGVTITGALIGTADLYRFADANPAIGLRSCRTTHNPAILGAIPNLVSINSAIEVDLTGQVNAEVAGGRYVGATGGQGDFARAGARSPGGRSIIALPATAKGGQLSRIVATLSGPVTTPRSDADIIVTEYGAAELKGQPIAERIRRMIAIADPAFREPLVREAHEIMKRGF